MQIYLNGQFYPADQAQISVEDAGFQHAMGLFETMFAYHGRIFRLDAHLARMARSAAQLGLAAEMNTAPLADAVNQTLAANHLEHARLRLSVTGGTMSLLKNDDGEQSVAVRQTVSVVPSEPTVFDPAYFDKGVTVSIYGPSASPFDITAGHKTLAYWARLRSLRQAAAMGCSETLWLNISNHLASGAVSNAFLVKDGTLLTPIASGEEKPKALAAPVLPGITRSVVIELAEKMGIEVQRRMLSVQELLDADEIFLTNSNWRVLPVTAIEKKTIGDGKPGEITGQLRNAVLDLITEETTA